LSADCQKIAAMAVGCGRGHCGAAVMARFIFAATQGLHQELPCFGAVAKFLMAITLTTFAALRNALTQATWKWLHLALTAFAAILFVRKMQPKRIA
jgi:hypothetical protein